MLKKSLIFSLTLLVCIGSSLKCDPAEDAPTVSVIQMFKVFKNNFSIGLVTEIKKSLEAYTEEEGISGQNGDATITWSGNFTGTIEHGKDLEGVMTFSFKNISYKGITLSGQNSVKIHGKFHSFWKTPSKLPLPILYGMDLNGSLISTGLLNDTMTLDVSVDVRFTSPIFKGIVNGYDVKDIIRNMFTAEDESES